MGASGDRPAGPELRVLIFAIGSLGEMVDELAVLHDIRSAYPQAVVDWAVEPAMATLLKRVDGAGDILECPLSAWRLWGASRAQRDMKAFVARMQKRRYDAVIDLYGDVRSAWIASKAKGRHFGPVEGPDGTSRPLLARWLADKTIALGAAGPAADRPRQLAARALGYQVEGPPRYSLRPRVVPLAKQTVAFVHGAEHDVDLWPETRWVTLGRRLVEQGWDVMLLQMDEAEFVRAERLAAAIDSQITAFRHEVLKGGPVVQVWPAMSTGMLVDRIAACHAVIGIDSGPSHLAAALDIPHVRIHNRSVGAALAASLPQHHAVVGGDAPPSVDAVWACWRQVERFARARALAAQAHTRARGA
jgi:heptosyltransferase-1